MRWLKITFAIAVASIFTTINASAQSTVAEIEWIDATGQYYNGLIVLWPNNSGFLYVKFYNSVVGNINVIQNAYLSNSVDAYGNVTSTLMCSYPKVSVPYVTYSADNFIFYPNGTVYTQDYAGKWSTLVQYEIIPSSQWRRKYREFGIE